MKDLLIQEIVLKLGHFDPEEIIISISQVNLEEGIPYVDVNIQTTSSDDVDEQKLRICFIGYLAAQISSGKSHSMDWNDDHPLLWDYNDLQASLYFSNSPADRYKLYWDLNYITKSLYESYGGLDKFLNTEVEFAKLMTSTYGLLANGPKQLLTEYAKCLEKHDMKYSIISEREPSFWNGQRMVYGRITPSILLIGESYIIANEFNVEKINE